MAYDAEAVASDRAGAVDRDRTGNRGDVDPVTRGASLSDTANNKDIAADVDLGRAAGGQIEIYAVVAVRQDSRGGRSGLQIDDDAAGGRPPCPAPGCRRPRCCQ